MAKTKVKKEQEVASLVKAISNSTSAVFANIQGLTVATTQDLKKKGKAEGVDASMIKKTLLRKVLKDLNIEVDPMTFPGGIGIFTTTGEPVAPAKLLVEFARTKDIVKVYGGVFEGKYITAEMVIQLSAIPSRNVLLSRLVGAINAPVSGFVRVLAGNMRGLVTVLDNISKQKA